MQTMKSVKRTLLAFVVALLALASLRPALAQGPSPADLLATLDSVQAQLDALSAKLDAGEPLREVEVNAALVLGLLLGVEDSLAPLYAQGWSELKAQAEVLYAQAGQAPPDVLRPLVSSLKAGVNRAGQAVERWASTGATFYMEDVGAYHGDEDLWVPVLASLPRGGLGSYAMVIGFDPKVVEVTDVEFKVGSGSWKADPQVGSLSINATGLKLGATEQPAELARVRFRVLGQEREMSVLSLRELSASDRQGDLLPATSRNASVRVLPGLAPPTMEPTATPTPAETGGSRFSLPPVVLVAIVAGLAVLLLALGVRFILSRR